MSAKQSYGNFHATADDDQAARVKKFVARNVLLFAAVLLMIISLIAFVAVDGSRGEKIDQQKAEILGLERAVAAQKRDNDSDHSQALRIATGGVDSAHRADDDKTVKGLLEMSLNWDGVANYLEQRRKVMDTYGFPEDSQFMRFFMPGELEGVARTAPSGETHYAFDENISNSFDSMESFVVGVNGDVYSYKTIVGMKTSSGDGQASATSYSLMHYDVVDGRITNIVAETTPGGIEVSG